MQRETKKKYVPRLSVALDYEKFRIVPLSFGSALDVKVPPPVGFYLIQVARRGGVYVMRLDSVEPYTRRDGRKTSLLVWCDQHGNEWRSGLRGRLGRVKKTSDPA